MATTPYVEAAIAQQEAGRRMIVRLVLVVFLLMIFEGVLRKWLLPEFQRPLYFVRDPFIGLIYVAVLMNGLILRSSMLAVLGVFAVFVSAIHLLLVLFGVGHPIAWGLGVRHYFFYIPLAFVIGYCFRFEDLAALIRLNLLLAIPIAALVFLQYRSPPSAWVNRAFAEDLDSVTYVALGVVRPYGTFTHTGGHATYVAASMTMLAVAWLQRREMRIPLWLLLPATAATLVMMLTTGSRTIWFFAANAGLCLVVAALSGGLLRHRLRALAFVVLVALSGIVLFASVLEPAYDAMVIRQEQAVRAEGSTLLRGIRKVTHAFEIMDQAPATGHGLGSGILSATATITGRRYFALAESEWDRIVLELGPMFGLGFIALRVALVAWLLWRALLANRAFGNPAGLVLFGFVGLHLLVGQVTMSGQGAIFAWLFVGFLLSATRRTDSGPPALRA